MYSLFENEIFDQSKRAEMIDPAAYVKFAMKAIKDFKDGYYDRNPLDLVSERKNLKSFAKAAEALALASEVLRPEILHLMFLKDLPPFHVTDDINSPLHWVTNREKFIATLYAAASTSKDWSKNIKSPDMLKNAEMEELLADLAKKYVFYTDMKTLPTIWEEEVPGNASPFFKIVNTVFVELGLSTMSRSTLSRFLKKRFPQHQ